MNLQEEPEMFFKCQQRQELVAGWVALNNVLL